MSEKYKKYTQIEHVIARPGMYIGDSKTTKSECWIIEEDKFVSKTCEWNPGIYKIFDEILTNASDEVQRNKEVKNIKITISRDEISVYNDSGIPIEIHKEYNIYVPELIFGNLLTSSNYDDSEKRTTGGLNGLGAKLTAIFSKEFLIETCKGGKKYTQRFSENLSKIDKPVISKSAKEYTKITFKPDFQKFGIDFINKDTADVLVKRVYDISAITPKHVNVYLNSEKIKVKDFQSYVSMYIGSKSEIPRITEETDRWKVCISPSNDGFKCVSFVNGINTSDGGTHVDHVLNPLIKKISEYLQEKHKNLTIKQQYIKENLFIFIDCLIENPSFSSQSKDKNITKVSDFGSKFIVTDEFIKSVTKLGIVNNILAIAEAKEKRNISKTDGKKVNRVIIPKLDDANKAGTKDSKDCTLILTEGDSAKTTAISGLSVVGRDLYGVFPLKGKVLNTRTASYTQLANNTEINNIKQILGLQSGRKYKDVDSLRYGKILIMTDADTDGFHIKSLLVNFIGNGWPELLKQDFILSLVTPVIKINKKSETLSFYNLKDYYEWKKDNKVNPNCIKYYKGLGTSTSTEAKEYFKNMKVLKYRTSDKEDTEYLDLAFTKTEADKRKKWILDNIKNPETLDYNKCNVKIKDLINKELVLFSIEDNKRSLPNLIDGLKPSQRKIIYACIKKNIVGEIKVSQLSGYVSEHTSYHHGEASLMDTTINLAQNFVGSNNINLLEPIGQFGTRLSGGKDSSSPRYIFTKLSKKFNELFNPEDFELLEYLDDDGTSIEPKFYVPTLPTILINGACGIGTGFSTEIPCFNPEDIKDRLMNLVKDEDSEIKELAPWYRNFKGSIEKVETNRWITKGIYSINNNMVYISELPIGVWTEDYKLILDKLETDDYIYSYINNSTEEDVNFTVKFRRDILDEFVKDNTLDKKLKMFTYVNARNIHVFNEKDEIVKIANPEEIIYRFWTIRNEYYIKRQKNILNKTNSKLELISSKIRFINDIVEDKIKIFRQKKSYIEEQLENNKYIKIENSYSYLTGMKIDSFTKETIDDLTKKYNDLKEYNLKIGSFKLIDFWENDLYSK